MRESGTINTLYECKKDRNACGIKGGDFGIKGVVGGALFLISSVPQKNLFSSIDFLSYFCNFRIERSFIGAPYAI